MVLVSDKPMNSIVLTGLIAIVMHFLQTGRKRHTLPGTEEPMITLDFITKKRREASAFMPGMDRRWARRAQCPRAQQYPRSARALNGRGHCIGGSPGIHAGEDVHAHTSAPTP